MHYKGALVDPATIEIKVPTRTPLAPGGGSAPTLGAPTLGAPTPGAPAEGGTAAPALPGPTLGAPVVNP